MTATTITFLNLLHLNPGRVNIFPAIKNLSLLSVVQLCDSEYKAIFDNKQVQIITSLGNMLLKGFRDPTTRLWLAPISTLQPPLHKAYNINLSSKAKDIVEFLHAACYSPSISTRRSNKVLFEFMGILSRH